MNKIFSVILIAFLFILPVSNQAQKVTFNGNRQATSPQIARVGFIIHGGAGVIRRGDLSPQIFERQINTVNLGVFFHVAQNIG